MDVISSPNAGGRADPDQAIVVDGTAVWLSDAQFVALGQEARRQAAARATIGRYVRSARCRDRLTVAARDFALARDGVRHYGREVAAGHERLRHLDAHLAALTVKRDQIFRGARAHAAAHRRCLAIMREAMRDGLASAAAAAPRAGAPPIASQAAIRASTSALADAPESSPRSPRSPRSPPRLPPVPDSPETPLPSAPIPRQLNGPAPDRPTPTRPPAPENRSVYPALPPQAALQKPLGANASLQPWERAHKHGWIEAEADAAGMWADCRRSVVLLRLLKVTHAEAWMRVCADLPVNRLSQATVNGLRSRAFVAALPDHALDGYYGRLGRDRQLLHGRTFFAPAARRAQGLDPTPTAAAAEAAPATRSGTMALPPLRRAAL